MKLDYVTVSLHGRTSTYVFWAAQKKKMQERERKKLRFKTIQVER